MQLYDVVLLLLSICSDAFLLHSNFKLRAEYCTQGNLPSYIPKQLAMAQLDSMQGCVRD